LLLPGIRELGATEMTTPSLGQQRLHELAAGTVLANEGLREYQAVALAAKGFFMRDSRDWFERREALRDALRAGGFLE
jgi:hypothetical protein